MDVPANAHRLRQLLLHGRVPFVAGLDLQKLQERARAKTFVTENFDVIEGLEMAVNRVRAKATPGYCVALFFQYGTNQKKKMNSISKDPTQEELFLLAQNSVLWIFVTSYLGGGGATAGCAQPCCVDAMLEMQKSVYCTLSDFCKHEVLYLTSCTKQYAARFNTGLDCATPPQQQPCETRRICADMGSGGTSDDEVRVVPVTAKLLPNAQVRVLSVASLPPDWPNAAQDVVRNWQEWARSVEGRASQRGDMRLRGLSRPATTFGAGSFVLREGEAWFLAGSSADYTQVELEAFVMSLVYNRIPIRVESVMRISTQTPAVQFQIERPPDPPSGFAEAAPQQGQNGSMAAIPTGYVAAPGDDYSYDEDEGEQAYFSSAAYSTISKDVNEEEEEEEEESEDEDDDDDDEREKGTSLEIEDIDVSPCAPGNNWVCVNVSSSGTLSQGDEERVVFQDTLIFPNETPVALSKVLLKDMLAETNSHNRYTRDENDGIVYKIGHADTPQDMAWFRAQTGRFSHVQRIAFLGPLDLIFASVEALYQVGKSAYLIGKAAAPFIRAGAEEGSGGTIAGIKRVFRKRKGDRQMKRWRKDIEKEVKKHPEWSEDQIDDYSANFLADKMKDKAFQFAGERGKLNALLHIQRLSLNELKVLGKPVLLDLWMIGALKPIQERLLWFSGTITEQDVKSYAPYIQGTAPSFGPDVEALLRPKPLVDERSGKISSWDESVSLADVVPFADEEGAAGSVSIGSCVALKQRQHQTQKSENNPPASQISFEELSVLSGNIHNQQMIGELFTATFVIGAAIVVGLGLFSATATVVGPVAAAATPTVLAGWSRGAGGWGDKLRRTKRKALRGIKKLWLTKIKKLEPSAADEKIAQDIIEKSKDMEPMEAVRILQEMSIQDLQSLPPNVLAQLVARNILTQDQVGLLLSNGLIDKSDIVSTIYDISYIAHLQKLSKRQLLALPLETLRLFMRAGVLTLPQVKFLLDQNKIQKGDIRGTIYKRKKIKNADQLESLPDNEYDPTIQKLAVIVNDGRLSHRQLLLLSKEQTKFFLNGSIFTFPQVKFLLDQGAVKKNDLKLTSYVYRAVKKAEDLADVEDDEEGEELIRILAGNIVTANAKSSAIGWDLSAIQSLQAPVRGAIRDMKRLNAACKKMVEEKKKHLKALRLKRSKMERDAFLRASASSKSVSNVSYAQLRSEFNAILADGKFSTKGKAAAGIAVVATGCIAGAPLLLNRATFKVARNKAENCLEELKLLTEQESALLRQNETLEKSLVV